MNYLLRRLAVIVPMLFGISVITFMIVTLSPGDPVTALINPEDMNVRSAEEIEQLREDLGLNDPLPVRYAYWLRETVSGNLGYSLQNQAPVLRLIWDRLPETLALSGTSMALALVIGTSLGAISALRQYTGLDYVLTVVAFFGLSVPGFFIAMLGMFAFSVKLQWLPVFGMWTPGQEGEIGLDLLRHAILPVSALAVPQIAGFMRYSRAAVLDARGQDHVTTARAKGLRERVVVRRHVVRNALLPLVTILGLQLPNVIGGSFVIESIFSWPGIGMLGYTAILQRDYPLQLGIALIAAVAVLFANLITDLIYGLVDPRIRYE